MDDKLVELEGYIVNKPYEKIMVISPNMYYGELIMNDYSGIEGKLTQYLQYRYHYFRAKQIDFKERIHIEKIARVKEYHMELLAELLCVLGTLPVYRAGLVSESSHWDTKYVCYGKDLKEQLEMDMDLEYKTIRNYNNHIQLISDPFIKNFLMRLLADEELHVKWLEYLLNV